MIDYQGETTAVSDDLRSQPAVGGQPAVSVDASVGSGSGGAAGPGGGALSGDELRRAFGGALAWLEEHRDTVNALNVFPVPDGDTGTNMLLTLRRAMEPGPDTGGGTAAEAAHSLAQGAFLGARGNSGVILSQFFKGFAVALEGRTDCDGAALAEALAQAQAAAYRAVSQPVEGTMLTVIREAAEAAQPVAESGQPPAAVLSAAFEASRQSLLRTPELLPVLREAGVVDSGGLGIVVILGGALAGLTAGTAGDNAAPETPPGATPGFADEHPILSLVDSSLAAVAGGGLSISSEYLHTTLDTDWGYCTEFIISGQELNPDRVRAHYEQTMLSTVVVGDARQVRVHIHAEDPGPALSYAVALGTLSSVKIESMDDQNVDFAAAHSGSLPSGSVNSGDETADDTAPLPAVELAVTAVVSGAALTRLFRELGCAVALPGGQTMNPSVQQLLDAAGRSGGRTVIILPNNKNIIATAQQAAAVNPALRVVPSRSLPQGIAALLAYNPEHSPPDNLAAMTAALDGVASIEVTRSVRDTSIGGVAVAAGDYIALLDDALLSAHATAEAALLAGLHGAGLHSDSIVTVYLGAEAEAAAAGDCAAALEQAHPGIQVDLVDGGQPHYQYLASVE